MRRAGEGLVAAVLGAALGGLVTALFGLPLAGVVIGGVNGLIGGALFVYDWRSVRGVVAFVLDSTWGLLGTSLGLVLHAMNLVWPRADYIPEISRRRGRHVYGGGVALRGGFALSMGNVISNAAGKVGLRGESDRVRRRRQFVTAHEELHIWQNRWFGPFFHLIYGSWLIGGGLVGLAAWPLVGGRPFNAIETVAYYDNPFEYWAYRNDGYWPPRGIHPKLAWRPRRVARPDR